MTHNARPVIPVASPSMPSLEEFVAEIAPLWENHILTHQGEKYWQLERAIAEELGVEYAPLFANGHLALQIALRALGFERGDEVITTPFTFASTTQAIVECGLVPVFCDVDPATFCIDSSKVEGLVTERTKAILGVHVYGIPCDVLSIGALAEKHGLKVVYDAAHAFGVKVHGRSIASYGDCSMFSFHATKVFNTVEGGALAFDGDAELYERACAIRQFGSFRDKERVTEIGTNGKMTELHAAMGLCNLRHVEEARLMREEVFRAYRDELADVKGIRVIDYPEDLTPNYAYFPVVLDEERAEQRDELLSALEQQGYLARKYFYPLTSEFECYEGRFPLQETPIAKSLSERVLCFPLHTNMSAEDARVVSRIVLGELSAWGS